MPRACERRIGHDQHMARPAGQRLGLAAEIGKPARAKDDFGDGTQGEGCMIGFRKVMRASDMWLI